LNEDDGKFNLDENVVSFVKPDLHNNQDVDPFKEIFCWVCDSFLKE
jgi:hypothetical protein